ncbi:MAG: hypothetical protein ACRENL_09385 [Candidatus Dormibacteria bacterium]
MVNRPHPLAGLVRQASDLLRMISRRSGQPDEAARESWNRRAPWLSSPWG